MTEQTIIKTLEEKVAGKLWENYGKRRIYIEAEKVFPGLIEKLNDIRWDGGRVEMSKTQQRFLWSNMAAGKIYFDLVDGKFHTKLYLTGKPLETLFEYLNGLIA